MSNKQNKLILKSILLLGINGALLGPLFAGPSTTIAPNLSQQVVAKPSSPNLPEGESRPTWSRQQEKHLLDDAKLALATRDAAPLLKLYDWNGVTPDARRNSTKAVKELVQRKIESILIQPKGLGGNIEVVENGRVYMPNGTVLAHLIFRPSDDSPAIVLPLGMRNEKLVILGFWPKNAQ